MITRQIALADEGETRALGRRIITAAQPSDCFTLTGDLGVGKTALARAAIQALLGPDCAVPSPTFTLVQIYEGPSGRIWHFDLYRIGAPDELLELGIEEAARDIMLVEWPDNGAPYLPDRHIALSLSFAKEAEARHVEISADGAWFERFDRAN